MRSLHQARPLFLRAARLGGAALLLISCGSDTGRRAEPTTPITVSAPWSYGDDAVLDALWDDCADGDPDACDLLDRKSPAGSDYEEFGDTCGGRTDGGGCTVPDPTINGDPWSYGDDATLDALWDDCADGDSDACDSLYWDSLSGSDYEEFGDTCGGRTDGGGCTVPDPTIASEPWSYGDDAVLDALWDDCADGDPDACDSLYWDSPAGSDYEEFGDTCGGRTDGGGCTVPDPTINGDPWSYGDDATLDALWDDCADGDSDACDSLYWDSPSGSDYEEFGDTCGGRTDGGGCTVPDPTTGPVTSGPVQFTEFARVTTWYTAAEADDSAWVHFKAVDEQGITVLEVLGSDLLDLVDEQESMDETAARIALVDELRQSMVDAGWTEIGVEGDWYEYQFGR